MKTALILLEYILIPLGVILVSFSLKKKLKKQEPTIDEFLEDLNIDIKIISSLCLLLYGISCYLHNESNNSLLTSLSVFCIITALLGYILIYHLPEREYNQKPVDSNTRLFGADNALYLFSSWYIIILTIFVITGIILKRIAHQATEGTFNFIVLIIIPLFIFVVPEMFFYILNESCKSFFRKTAALNNTYNRAFWPTLEKDAAEMAIKGLQAALASMHRHDPHVSGILQRLAELYEQKKDFASAEKYWIEVILLLENEKVNQSVEYICDAYCELIDFYRRTHQHHQLEQTLKNARIKYPQEARFQPKTTTGVQPGN